MKKYFTDQDLYKFTTMYYFQKLFPKAEGTYEFICRNNTKFPIGFDELLKKEIQDMNQLRLTSVEANYMRKKCYYFDEPFINLLEGYRYNPSEVNIQLLDSGDLKIKISGLIYRITLWEIDLLALISELYFKVTGQEKDNLWIDRIIEKSKKLEQLGTYFSDFGTRRRYSFDVQDKVVEIFKSNPFFNGTSNIYLAMKYDVTPIGTHPHEVFMHSGSHYGYRMANHYTLENWSTVYQGSLGIALSDTYTSDSFFKSFNLKFSKLFDGVRWDSGSPFEFTDKTINHYLKLKIDPKSKTIVYSDSLNLELVEKIHNHVAGRIKEAYGIGTFFTNDVGIKPLNIVIKMTSAKPEGYDRFINTVKLSDVAGKHTGDLEEIKLCKQTLNIE